MSNKQIKCRLEWGLAAAMRGVFSAKRAFLVAALVTSSALWTACGPMSSDDGMSQTPDASGVVWIEPAGDWKVEPTDDFDSAAWHPVYSIHNRSQSVLQWEVRRSKSWLRFPNAMQGELAPGEVAQVAIDIDPDGVAEDGASPAFARVTFVDRATGIRFAQRSVTVKNVLALEEDGGWTSIDASPDTRRVYVSSSRGNDEADGLSPNTAKRTIAAGKSLLRHGYPDWLLLQRGDTWHEGLGQWKKSGRSKDEPMLVTSFGDGAERPVLMTGSVTGVWTNGGSGSPSTIDNWAIIGLSFVADGYNGDGNCIGAQILQPGTHVLIEDCKFSGYSTNLVFQGLGGRHTDIRLRRSVVVDAYSIHGSGNHPEGLYAYGVDGLVIEENVFDHNGWNESVPGAGADIFSHNLYIDNGNTGVVVRGNIIANASSHGMQLRSGGVVQNNLFLRNSISLAVGGGNDPEPNGVTADVRGNVVLEGKDIDDANPRGWGMWFANISSGKVAFNVIANAAGNYPIAMTLDGNHQGDDHPSIGVHDLVIERNILYNWGVQLRVDGNASEVDNIDLRKNDFQDGYTLEPLIEHLSSDSIGGFHSGSNRFFSTLGPLKWIHVGQGIQSLVYWMSHVGDTSSLGQLVAYTDPSRTLGNYNAALGAPANVHAFLAEAREQSRTHWQNDYTAQRINRYVRLGFQVLGN